MDARSDSPKHPIRVHLQKSRFYNWEIAVGGASVDEILSTLREIDTKLRREYGSKEA